MSSFEPIPYDVCPTCGRGTNQYYEARKRNMAAAFRSGVPARTIASGYLIWFGVSTKEECVDPDGFFSWLRENPDEVSKAFNPNTARKGSIPPAVRGTFFEKTLYGEPKMQSVPVEVLKPKGSRIG